MAVYDLIACAYVLAAVGLAIYLFIAWRKKREDHLDTDKARRAMKGPTKSLDEVRKELKL